MPTSISSNIKPGVIGVDNDNSVAESVAARVVDIVVPVRQIARENSPSRKNRPTLTALMMACCILIAPGTSFGQSATAAERLQDAGVATVNELNALERKHQAELERLNQLSNDAISNLQYKIEQLERRLSRIEKARQLEERRAEEASFEKSRMLNWPKAASGMNRREIYRLIGSGVKDRTETSRDCRCYSQGKICFTDEDLAEKSNVRCQL